MNIIASIRKYLYWPICRTYARSLVKDNSADSIYRWLCSLQFKGIHGYWPNFSHPQRFSEKVWSRMLHDRNPLLTTISDKLLVRDYVSEKVGNDYLIPLLWSGENPNYIPFDDLPHEFVIKANHGCGYNIIVRDKSHLDHKEIRLKLRKWLNENFCEDKYVGMAWGYRNVKPIVIIEKFVGIGSKAPVDYKFYCFSGRIELLTMHFDRFEGHKTLAFDRDFNPHEFRYDFPNWNGECERPKNFDEMVQLAESLAQGFDFIRVDLYDVGEKIYFSELTPYPGGVSTKFLPVRQDYILGEKWKMKL